MGVEFTMEAILRSPHYGGRKLFHADEVAGKRNMGPENGTNDVYEARTSEELGRYLIAARDLAPGDLVLTERPLVFGPKATLDPDTMPCVGCYKPIQIDAGERCAKCGWPVCSGNCPGLTDPRHHGVECIILSTRPECILDNMPDYYRHDALLPLRCALLQSTDPDRWLKTSDMQSHMECRTPGTDTYDEADEFIVEYLMNNFISKLDQETKKKYLPEISTELLHRLCGIIDTNALEIRLLEGTELLALFANTCIMEHSCFPNTKHTFNYLSKDRNDLYKITIKVTVPVMKGDHITTMYSHALWGTQARRQHLKDTKYFACKCVRCADPTELGTYLSAMKCIGDGNEICDGIHLAEDPLDEETDWACNKCAVKVNNSEVSMIISQMSEEVETVQMMGGPITILENLLCRLSLFLHPNHYHLYSVKHSLIQLYGRQPGYTSDEIIDRKIRMCKELIDITKKLDPVNARLSLYNAVLHNELHSALMFKIKKENSGGSSKSNENVKSFIIEAKSAIEIALESLKDEMEELSGKKLFAVIAECKKEFDEYCIKQGLA